MPKTHQFTKNADEKAVEIVLDKIVSFEWDSFSECTSIKLCNGENIGVSESIDEVRKILNDSDRN
jgi:uncharacterized protein YlzI (FlbEa/FlbD family)